ncbi:MAG TPA: methyltransferase domain-containing protein [Candidatus Saccharimonadales bacterium]|nr:methyltransferase domain-containing protein [Candidatus Saccharimonadales bacterium]
MNRIVQPELLDELPVDDPRAQWSRCDLRRINAWMRNHAIMARALKAGATDRVPRQIVDLGAGDGNLLLRVARKMSPAWNGITAILLDRQSIITGQTSSSFATLGWQMEAVEADVFGWLSAAASLDVVVANLFLHHFDDTRLAELFLAVADRARLFVAIETRRAPWPLFCCRLLWIIGCNSVTRHDAAISVRAGFSGNELSALWPKNEEWQLTEKRSGFFSHLFVAQRKD